jgi:hypothetical protein
MSVITLEAIDASLGSAAGGFTNASIEGNTSFEALLQMGDTGVVGSVEGAPIYSMTLERYVPSAGLTLWMAGATANNGYSAGTFGAAASNKVGPTLNVFTATSSFSMTGRISGHSFSMDAEGALIESITVSSTGVGITGAGQTVGSSSSITPMVRGSNFSCSATNVSCNMSLNIQPVVCLGTLPGGAYDIIPQYPAETTYEESGFGGVGIGSVGGSYGMSFGPFSASLNITSDSVEGGGADGGPRTYSFSATGFNTLNASR